MKFNMLAVSLVICILISDVVTTSAQNISFKSGTWSETLALAKKENKLIFLDIYATWCGPCRAMAKNVFTQQKVADRFNTRFINYQLDAEKNEGPAIAEKYKVGSFPTYLFIDGSGKLVYKIEGALDADKFIAEADHAAEKFSSPDHQ